MTDNGKGGPFSIKAVNMLKSLFSFFTQPLLKRISSWFQFPLEGLIKVCSEGVDIAGNQLDTRREGGKRKLSLNSGVKLFWSHMGSSLHQKLLSAIV